MGSGSIVHTCRIFLLIWTMCGYLLVQNRYSKLVFFGVCTDSTSVMTTMLVYQLLYFPNHLMVCYGQYLIKIPCIRNRPPDVLTLRDLNSLSSKQQDFPDLLGITRLNGSVFQFYIASNIQDSNCSETFDEHCTKFCAFLSLAI